MKIWANFKEGVEFIFWVGLILTVGGLVVFNTFRYIIEWLDFQREQIKIEKSMRGLVTYEILRTDVSSSKTEVILTIGNKSKYDVKDLNIYCEFYAESETKLGDENYRIYKKLPAITLMRLFNITLNVPKQAQRADCRLVDYYVEDYHISFH